jgi:probable rRNA maturation factor
LSINIFHDNISFRLKDGRKIKKLISRIISEEYKISGDINIIITDDNSILKINTEYLQHNYFTDVISFSYYEEGTINGEVYISIDTVKTNAYNYNVSLNEELLRVLIHGILHLTGYEDNTKSEKISMSEMENKWIREYNRIRNEF